MLIIIWIIVAIIMFSVIVLIHEWWHFAAARKFWVRVEEFWLGIPPRAKKLFYDKKWTLFSLNWLPIWGFVKLTWEMPNTFLVYNNKKELYNNENLEKDLKENKKIFDKNWKEISIIEKEQILKLIEENNADYNLANKKSWQQAIIILAWIFMNFLLAFIIFTVLFFIWIKPIWINNKIETNLNLQIIPTMEQAYERWFITKNNWVILFPVEWSLAEKSWILEWDILIKIWEKEIENPKQVIEIISNSVLKNIDLILIRNWNEQKIEIKIPYEWKIWTYLWENIEINQNYLIKYWPLESIKYWFLETKNQILLTFKWLSALLKKIFNPETPEERKEAIEQVKWPIWIVDFISNSISAWIIFIFIIWAIISINLWVFNLLPIPALDWWRFLFITVNWLIKKIFWRKAISEKVESIVHFWFFVLLIALSLIIAYNDINNIISK